MIAGLLLAAGGARRFGAQKLLASVDGMPLVRHAALHLAQSVAELVIVVGCDAELVRDALDGVAATIVQNAAWASGIAGSICSGVGALPLDAEAVVVALGDEPRIDPAVTRAIISRWEEARAPIVSARYRGVRGHPVLFDRRVFFDLAALAGDAGARSIIERRAHEVVYVDIDAERPVDVDTPADLPRLRE